MDGNSNSTLVLILQVIVFGRGNPSVFHRARSAGDVWEEKQNLQVYFALCHVKWVGCQRYSQKILFLLLRSDNFFCKEERHSIPLLTMRYQHAALDVSCQCSYFSIFSMTKLFAQACFAAVTSVSLPSLLPLGLM